MSATYQVTGAAAFVTRKAGSGELFYRGAGVPDDATNLDALIDSGLVTELDKDETAGGHPSDVPEGYTPPEFPSEDKPTAAKKTAASKPAE